MGAVAVSIAKIDGKLIGSKPISLSGDGPWLVEGKASSAGFTIVQLSYEIDPSIPAVDIDRNNLPGWQFYVTAGELTSSNPIAIAVTALDDEEAPNGPGGGTAVAFVNRVTLMTETTPRA